MRWLGVCLLFVMACDGGDSEPRPGAIRKPVDPSLSLSGEKLDTFCRSEGSQPDPKTGVWKCEAFARCKLEVGGCDLPHPGVGCDPYQLCRAK